ncbi:MAG TPA: SRPBCC domain-containing protein [Rhizomicrobium sp.]|nr:SRPBCC domain-containing protein [Rhizomicrobium sp.]
MTKETVHATIVVERDYPFSPERVFAAYANADAYRQWHAASGVTHELTYEFRAGGRLATTFGSKDGPKFHSEGHFEDIVPNERIVSAGSMHGFGHRSSSTLCTVELRAHNGGTHLTLTDQSVYYAGETPQMRNEGWNGILDTLGSFLQRKAA